LQEFKPVAIVLDVLLEGEHSWQLLQELKQNPSTSDIPVFVVTVVENEAKAMALGANGFHAKPIDRAWLLAELDATVVRDAEQILIVDDDEISRYLVRGLLASTGYRLIEATGGMDGLKLARQCKPSLIVLDLSMPDVNGFEVLESLKRDQETAAIPVVIYTSQELDIRDRSRLQDAADVIPKQSPSREHAGARFLEALTRAGLRTKADASAPSRN
jgi:CheY-like chemotaxis protein